MLLQAFLSFGWYLAAMFTVFFITLGENTRGFAELLEKLARMMRGVFEMKRGILREIDSHVSFTVITLKFLNIHCMFLITPCTCTKMFFAYKVMFMDTISKNLNILFFEISFI